MSGARKSAVIPPSARLSQADLEGSTPSTLGTLSTLSINSNYEGHLAVGTNRIPPLVNSSLGLSCNLEIPIVCNVLVSPAYPSLKVFEV